MNASNRASTAAGGLLIAFGVLFLAINLFGFDLGRIWPIIFFFIAAGFYLPIIIFPTARAGLAALFIPGTITLGLGLIFLYNTSTDDWGSWAYAWALIPASVGVGMMLASRVGRWGPTSEVGLWMALISLGVFGAMATLFGNQIFRVIGPILLIAGGVRLFFRSMRRPKIEA